MYRYLQVFSEGLLTWIVFNRPEKLNAFNEELWKELHDALTRLSQDDSRAVVLTGVGRAFSAGDDIAEMLSLKSLDRSVEFFGVIQKTVDALLRLDKPVIACVNGLAYGGGCELLLLADIVVASEDSVFAIPEARLGLIPPIALTVGGHVLGLRRISRLVFTGEAIDAREAHSIGLVDYIVPKNVLKDKVLEVAGKIFLNGPAALRLMRRWLARSRSHAIQEALTNLPALAVSDEAVEGMKAFMEKRKPSWAP
ncbi:MAG: enoyl-CoA hydratase/isomerase family protein [Candidatus Caldarchaeum sp.]